jgi:predicted dehydrogenase
MREIGVAIVGTGFGASVHIPGLQKHPRTKVVALYHREEEKARQLALEHNIEYHFSNLSKILALKDVEAVALSTPPFLHYPMAKEILLARKHLLLEKPMTMTLEQAQELYHLAGEQGVRVTADFEFRTIPAWQLLAQYLQQEYIGKIRLVKVDWLVASRANSSRPWNWYSQEDCGGGILGAIGSHTFDYLHWLFGPAKRLSAQLYCSIKERKDPQDNNVLKPVDAEDTAIILMELADKTPLQINLSSVTYQGRGHWLEIYGDKGTLVLGSSNLKDYVHGFKLYTSLSGGPLYEVEIPPELEFSETFPDGRIAPFINIVERWVDSIDSAKEIAPSLDEGVYSQMLLDLARFSNSNQRWVEVPEKWL